MGAINHWALSRGELKSSMNEKGIPSSHVLVQMMVKHILFKFKKQTENIIHLSVYLYYPNK